jgi:hypothetical protein
MGHDTDPALSTLGVLWGGRAIVRSVLIRRGDRQSLGRAVCVYVCVCVFACFCLCVYMLVCVCVCSRACVRVYDSKGTISCLCTRCLPACLPSLQD